MAGEHELVPEVDQIGRPDVVADVVGRAFGEDLLLHAPAVVTIVEVVRASRLAPRDVQRQFDYARGLRLVVAQAKQDEDATLPRGRDGAGAGTPGHATAVAPPRQKPRERRLRS